MKSRSRLEILTRSRSRSRRLRYRRIDYITAEDTHRVHLLL